MNIINLLVDKWIATFQVYYKYAVQSQKAVSAHLKSEQILLFDFAEQRCIMYDDLRKRNKHL